MLGLYLHIPFCAAICNYCNFNRGLFDAAVKPRYLDALTREIARSGRGEPADTIFFGGGTPSILEPAEIAQLITACRDAFDVTADAEITLETNPETSSPARMAGFRDAGVNRVSFGVQSFDPAELVRLGRVHTVARAREACREARQAGFDNISLDLMMWLPGQSRDDWARNVDALIDLGPEHASLYLLEIYPNAPLRDEMARAGWSQAPDDDAAEMYVTGLAMLDRAGYEQYEISNVARPGRRARHNLKYWTGGEWHGFGCGAHSTRGGRRWKNVSATGEYIARLDAGEAPTVEERCLSAQEQVEEALFMGLRLTEGIDTAEIQSRHDVDVWERYGDALRPYLDVGLVVRRDNRLGLTREGMLVANEILQVFV
jgi:oxygen-independent coproporphyrinogen III oxidase